jgi:hypothetical protein
MPIDNYDFIIVLVVGLMAAIFIIKEEEYSKKEKIRLALSEAEIKRKIRKW